MKSVEDLEVSNTSMLEVLKASVKKPVDNFLSLLELPYCECYTSCADLR